MAQTQPLFGIGDLVFLRESAVLGHIEGYKVSSLSQSEEGKWLYTIAYLSRPAANKTLGDRIDLKVHGQTVVLKENTLVTHCDALDLAIDNLTRRLNDLTLLRSEVCDIEEPTATG